MYHRKPEKYKEFENMQNVIVGKGELVRIDTEQGEAWRTPFGDIFYDKQSAMEYAKKLNQYIYMNTLAKTRRLNKHKVR